MSQHFRGGGGFPSRDGLNTRNLFAQPAEQGQVILDMGPASDLDSDIEGLRSQVGQLKELSRNIGEASRENGQLQETLEEYLEQGRVKIKRAMKRLNRAYDQSKSNHLLYLALFVVGVFLLLYFWIKLYRLVRWVV